MSKPYSPCDYVNRAKDNHPKPLTMEIFDSLLNGMDVKMNVEKVREHTNKSVIINGGEPTIQKDLGELVSTLKDAGYWVALETNGVRAPSCAELFDYIAVSPKPDYFSRYMDNLMIREANEVRIVATTDEIVGFCRSMRARIKATDYYISPLETDGRMHYRRALNLLMKLKKTMPDAMPPWSLSIQMHKVIGVR